MADTSWLKGLSGIAGEATKIAKADTERRAAAAKEANSIILSQKDILTGKWDASKVLKTTLGGVIRDITPEDLRTFQRNIQAVHKTLSKGITAKQIIDLSLQVDRDRAKEQITMATPVMSSNGKVRFLTNASKGSKDTRHHVLVEFLDYGAWASSGAKDAKKAAQQMRKGAVKFDCDCGRHTFWFRYISTIGGFNAGRAETGFPKIRNPNLRGVACKHVLRVMAEVLNGPSVLLYLTRILEKAQSSDTAKAQLKIKQAAAEKIIKGQAKRTTGNEVKTSQQKKEERAAAALKKTAGALPPPKQAAPATRREATKSTGLVDAQLAAIESTLRAAGVPQSAIEAALNAARNAQ